MAFLQKMFPAMGTVNTITIFDPDQRDAAQKAKDYILSLEYSLSVFRKESEASRINRLKEDEWLSLSPDTYQILVRSLYYSSLTGGAFDLTSMPLAMLWKEAMKKGRPVSEREVKAVKAHVGYDGLKLDHFDQSIIKQKADLSVDFGGIAKGFALDKVLTLLRKEGVQNALVDLGGTVGILGQPHRVGIQNPFERTGVPMGSVLLGDSGTGQIAVTSGVYEQSRQIDGQLYHHIIDPRTGHPAQSGLISVTLIGNDACAMDAMATAAMVLGRDRILPLLSNRNLQAIFVTEAKEVLVTDGLSYQHQIFAA